MKTIVIADDHPVTLAGMRVVVENLGFDIVSTFTDGIRAYDGIVQLKPAAAILDLNMPGMNGLELLEKLRKNNKDIKIIIYTMYHEKAFLNRAIALGVNGYLLKDFALEELSICLEKVSKGENWFSPKLDESLTTDKYDSEKSKLSNLTASEKKILMLIAEDHKTKAIAEMLFISEKTVEKHRSNIIKKLGLPNEQNVLQRFALQNNLLTDMP
jgi:DNA-binding NarL/FixJ family response regulator